MYRTVALIVFLLVLSAGLVYVALQPRPAQNPEKPGNSVQTSLSPTPAPDTVLSLSPNQLTVSTGSASVSVDINTGKNLVSGVQLEVAYDPNVLTNVKVTPGTFFTDPVVILNTNDQTSGRISYALGISPAQNPIQGIGQVATITFSKRATTTPSPSNSTDIILLPKSLVSMMGAQTSVLKEATGAKILFETTGQPL